jgi:nucleotide-binding universal stress UspA family protein
MTTSQVSGPRVVVGVDGSANSRRALGWAGSAAETMHAQLVAVYAYRTPGDPFEGAYGPTPQRVYHQLRTTAEQELSRQLTEVLGADHVASVAQIVEPGSADEVLIEHGNGADLVVVGSQGHSRLPHLGLGSTAEDVIRHAPCPVIVVREQSATQPGPQTGRVVVAIGESPHMAVTLEFGFGFASRAGLPLTVLHAWDTPLFHQIGRAAPVVEPDIFEHFQQAERQALTEAIAGWSSKYPEVEVREVAIPDDKVASVIAASAGAALLVVGAHHRKIPGSLALGAVTHAAVHHAYCPVAIVPAQPH